MSIDLSKYSKEEVLRCVLEYANRESHELVSSVAHDVKNPLGIIDLSLGLLEDRTEKILEEIEDDKVKKKIRTFLENISIGLEKCEYILDNVLLLRRMDADYEATHSDSIASLLDHYYIFSKPALKSKRISFEHSVEGSVLVNINRKSFMMVLNGALGEIVNSISCEKGAIAHASFEDNTITITLNPKDESFPLKLQRENGLEVEIKTQLFYDELKRTKYSYSINEDNGKIMAKINLPS